MSDKVRPLKEEVSILLYISQFVLCLVAAIIQLYWYGFSVVFLFLTVAVLINAFIIGYIIVNRNKYVLAQLKAEVFVGWKKDNAIHSILAGMYGGAVGFSITDLIKTKQDFYPSEFECAFGIIALIILIYWLLKINRKNKDIANAIDRLIDKYIIGVISQEEAYKNYILPSC